MFENLIFLLFAVSITYLANKKNLIPNFTGDPHQKFFKQEKVPLIGGILILISLSRFYLNDIIILSFVAIFLVGFLSDSKILSSSVAYFMKASTFNMTLGGGLVSNTIDLSLYFSPLLL